MGVKYRGIWCGLKKLPFFDMVIDKYSVDVKKNVVIYSCMGFNQREAFSGADIKIYITGEPIMSHPSADVVIGFVETGGKFIKLRNHEFNRLTRFGLDYPVYRTLDSRWTYREKSKFCCFIVRNPRCWQRNNMFELMSQYKHVDSLGGYRRNSNLLDGIKHSCEEYYQVISEYKFAIVFENCSKEHYLTEKIYNCLMAGTVPIYWGDPKVNEMISGSAIVHVPTARDRGKQTELLKQAVERVREIDQNDEMYRAMFDEPCCLDSAQEDTRVYESVKMIADCLS